MGDDSLNDCLIIYIENNIFIDIENVKIIQSFHKMKNHNYYYYRFLYILSPQPTNKKLWIRRCFEFLFILKLNWSSYEKKLNCSCFFLGKGKLFLASALREKNDTHFVDLNKRQPFLLSTINDAKHLHFKYLHKDANICDVSRH